MTEDLYNKAAEQALQSAMENGDAAPYYIATGLALIAFGCYMFHLENHATGYKKYLGRAIIGCSLGALLLLSGISAKRSAHHAKHNPELFIVQELHKTTDNIQPITCPAIGR